ncbi:MAG: hypothetical protein OXT09_10470 [Myxococcales bacterium]|nr:hypothetical protein [Myxococcales bacterium]
MSKAKETTMRNASITMVAIAAVLAGCQDVAKENDLPVAMITIEAGGETYMSDQGIEAGTADSVSVTLGSGNSSDEDGTVVGYQWVKTDIDAATRMTEPSAGDEGKSASITVDLGIGLHRFSLWVTDNEGAVSAPATVTVSIVSAAACIAAYESLIPDNTACAECLCALSSEGGCRDEVNTCFDNPLEAFTTQCLAIVDCAGMTGCDGAGCYTPDTCMAELDMGTVDYGGFPGGCTDPGPSEAPCPAATAFGDCQSANCAAACGVDPPPEM